MDSSKIESYVLVGTYLIGDEVRTAADEYRTEEDALRRYAELAADEQWAPHTPHTGEVMSRTAYDARHGLLPAIYQDTSRFTGALFSRENGAFGYARGGAT